jgi:hypothetical protein
MKQASKILHNWTGHDLKWWLNRVGVLIGESSYPMKGKGNEGLYNTNTVKWITKLSEEMRSFAENRIPIAADGNLVMSCLVGLILMAFFYRCGRAKCYDPRRDPRDRRMALKRMAMYAQMFAEVLLDDTQDPKLFPDQEWDHPFAKKAHHEPDRVEKLRKDFEKREQAKRKKKEAKA